MQNNSQIIEALKEVSGPKGFLNMVGWFESYVAEMPITKNGSPLPWFTYSTITFLEHRINKSMQICEYGGGNSTFWWSKRVEHVISFEHDLRWYNKLKPNLDSNIEMIFCELVYGGKYSKSILNYNNRFDIIVIDGRDRVNCAINSISALKDNGIIIWDDSDREQYQSGYDFLIRRGFKKIDFWGMGPGLAKGWCTSIFYKNDNCLGI